MSLKKIIAKWDSREASENVPFTHAEMREHFELNPNDREILNTSPNRHSRKLAAMPVDSRPVRNNRGNAGKKVYLKMAYFFLTGGRNPLGLNHS